MPVGIVCDMNIALRLIHDSDGRVSGPLTLRGLYRGQWAVGGESLALCDMVTITVTKKWIQRVSMFFCIAMERASNVAV